MINNLNYTINTFNGPKALDYKLNPKDTKELGFDPKFYLKCIIKVYLLYVDDSEFLKTIVNDERSFSLEIFSKTEKILRKYNLLFGDEME